MIPLISEVTASCLISLSLRGVDFLDHCCLHMKLLSCWKLFEFGANDSTCFCTLRSISAKTEQIEVNKFRWFWLKTIEISSSSCPSLISSFWRE